jgi:Uma2 family endonuclease
MSIHKLWSIDEYERMIEKGILDGDSRVELIRGEVIEMTPIGVRHAGCVINLQALFHSLLGDRVVVSVQNPIRLPNDSEPQPDVALLNGPRSRYSRQRPTAEDALLLIEVSDTTLSSDRAIKLPLYAEAEIANVWLINLNDDVIEVYSEPEHGNYRKVAYVGRGESLALPGGLPGMLTVDEILG